MSNHKVGDLVVPNEQTFKSVFPGEYQFMLDMLRGEKCVVTEIKEHHCSCSKKNGGMHANECMLHSVGDNQSIVITVNGKTGKYSGKFFIKAP